MKSVSRYEPALLELQKLLRVLRSKDLNALSEGRVGALMEDWKGEVHGRVGPK